ncbi:MAG: phosphoribosylglycinamide formyltransferase [Lachnospiraceae bacterium]|nr:phosphoribosylglycinamide formyltransferase [Lachnospiraceae bacterium]MBR5789009.1 phosphoribosylglycinamide formyltransferase [Lachnospiraceae bacterium]
MLRIAVLVSGGGTNLQAIMDAIDSGKITNTEISFVFSNNKKAYALERAAKKNIPTVSLSRKDYDSVESYDAAMLKEFNSRKIDLIVLAGFLHNLSAEFTENYKGRIINIHPSLIPSFCGKGFYGLHVHEAALSKGVKVTGATVHFVDAGIDTGRIIKQKAVYVEDGDTPEILQRRVMENAEWIILPEAINDIANGRIKLGE